jgi:hypothetical protein
MKLKAPSHYLFQFFRRSIHPPKRWVNVLPHMFRPVTSPLQHPPPLPPTADTADTIVRLIVVSTQQAASSSHPRPVLRPSLDF